ncbi:MAG TPA: amidohydrolase family protein [Myxococcota bacterium]|nr:amidohydrolase family protein [Myxococcota bacterium]
MPYAEGRTYHDADSHLMELSDWLAPYADPGIRERLRPLHLGGAGKLARDAVANAEQRRGDPEAARAAERNLMGAKGWSALGAFDRAERSRALDLLGFARQLVFSTFAPTQFSGDDLELAYGGARAHNRALADFCAEDPRLIAVGLVPWGDPERAALETEQAIRLGCGAVLLASAPSGDRSPTHPDYHGVWARLQDADVPFMLHIGGGGRPLRRAFHNNGKPVSDWLGGGENIRSKDFMAVHNAPETFLSCLVLDGVLEDFPRLRGGCIEQGALWVPAWLRRLDIAQQTFQKTEPALRLPRRASEYVHGRLWFTPFPTEPVGWLVEQAGDDLFLFSSDYPHPEGGRDPLGRFAESLAGAPPEALDKFYSANFTAMMGR